MMKRVLIISYYWPPAGGSGVQRWVKFAKYLPSEGWQPVVYTPLNPEVSSVDETLSRDIPADAEIIKRPIREPYGIYRRLFGRGSSTDMKTLIATSRKDSPAEDIGRAGATGGEVNPINGGSKSLKQRLSLWIRGNLFIPDPRIWWVRPSVRFLKKYLREHPVDVIVTTGPPQSMHLIGRGLHRATGIPWVADFRDPWTRMFYYKHLGLTAASDRKHHRLEQSVLDEASAVIAVSPLVQSDFQSQTSTPVVLITNGFDPADYPPFPTGTDSTRNHFRVVHTGLFAEDGNPLVLWDLLAEKFRKDEVFAASLEIRLAGKVDSGIINAIEARGLGSALRILGYLSHDEAVAEQRAADLLILPLRQEPEYRSVLPGKIFEYLAARVPVLGIGQEDGAAAAVLRDSGAGDMFDWDNASGQSDFLERVLDGQMREDGQKDIERYSRVSLTHRLAALLSRF